jgi:hypothetical protein
MGIQCIYQIQVLNCSWGVTVEIVLQAFCSFIAKQLRLS